MRLLKNPLLNWPKKQTEINGKFTDAKNTKHTTIESSKLTGGIHKKAPKPNLAHNLESSLLHRIPTLNYIKKNTAKRKNQFQSNI